MSNLTLAVVSLGCSFYLCLSGAFLYIYCRALLDCWRHRDEHK